MDFRVVYRDLGSAETFGDADRFTFDQHGHLVVFMKDGQRRVYSDHAWRYVETLDTPQPNA